MLFVIRGWTATLPTWMYSGIVLFTAFSCIWGNRPAYFFKKYISALRNILRSLKSIFSFVSSYSSRPLTVWVCKWKIKETINFYINKLAGVPVLNRNKTFFYKIITKLLLRLATELIEKLFSHIYDHANNWTISAKVLKTSWIKINVILHLNLYYLKKIL